MDFENITKLFEADNGQGSTVTYKMPELTMDETVVPISIHNSVASAIVDSFSKVTAEERFFEVGGVKYEIGPFVIALLQSNSLTGVLSLCNNLISHRETLADARKISKEEKYSYVSDNMRIKIAKQRVFDIANAHPTSIIDYLSNGRVEIRETSVASVVFNGSFILGNILANPTPYTKTSTRELKVVDGKEILQIGGCEVPYATLLFFWNLHARKEVSKKQNGSRFIGDIPWLFSGEKPNLFNEATINLFHLLTKQCKDFASDTIDDKPGFVYAAAWIDQTLLNSKTGLFKHFTEPLVKFYKAWKDEPASSEFGTMDAIAVLAGRMLNGCRVVRGKDNPGLEYAPWTLLPNIPWCITGAVKHRMVLGDIKIDTVLHSKNDLPMFPMAKHLVGTNVGWHVALGSSVFVVGEDIVPNQFFGIACIKGVASEELPGLIVLSEVAKSEKVKIAVLRLLLPRTSVGCEFFNSECRKLSPNWTIKILPSVTLHNLEAYMIITRSATQMPAPLFDRDVLTPMYHIYNASMICNWARTLCYCLMIPGNVGAKNFYHFGMKTWIEKCKKSLTMSFYVDDANRVEIASRAKFGINSDIVMAEARVEPRQAIKRSKGDESTDEENMGN